MDEKKRSANQRQSMYIPGTSGSQRGVILGSVKATYACPNLRDAMMPPVTRQ